MKRSKAYNATASTIEAEKLYSPLEAINAAKAGAKARPVTGPSRPPRQVPTRSGPTS